VDVNQSLRSDCSRGLEYARACQWNASKRLQ
jgi:hypothetical protein